MIVLIDRARAREGARFDMQKPRIESGGTRDQATSSSTSKTGARHVGETELSARPHRARRGVCVCVCVWCVGVGWAGVGVGLELEGCVRMGRARAEG